MITFAPTVLKEQIIIVEMGDDRFEELIDKKILREFIENKANNQSKQYYNFIDEMQMVKYFEGTIISLNSHSNYDVYIAGNNSKFCFYYKLFILQ